MNGGIAMFCYKRATLDELEQIWNRNIADNPEDPRYLRWKNQFMEDNASGAAATFVILVDGSPVGEGTLLLSPDCRAIRGRTSLCDGKTVANINALRIQESYEGLGHVSNLMHVIEDYAKVQGLSRLTIGVEATETRNLGIYLHWGYDQFVMSEEEDSVLVLYYGKDLF